ncbi:SDR family oxidoreductase [Actinomadura barringtoniae]|uniref:SDR family oxidoreductase n=1 Tax=Actinomadura barringtoniae TaxID=1427535 RepID=A0A939P6R8_9ACTN|nr:oxidoreductase [Actinomadura barringtoniae]MBO2445997.1 SDR family oxidoreductase [Actinomadura barringtoniae]
MDLNLNSKTAVVTGASRGIGLAVTRAFLSEGVRVVAGAREPADVPGTTPVKVDLADPAGPAALIDAAVEAYGGVDILVNNVGAARPRTGGFLSVTDEEWADALTINLMAAVRTTRAALPHLLERGGSIVTVSSVNARLPDPLVIDYCAAKAALTNFCKSLSKQVAANGVRVNTVSPGPVSTALWLGAGGVAETVAGAAGGKPGDIAAAAAAESATGRFSTPEEVAALVLFLAGEGAANITGSDFTIDGGLITTL